MSIIYSEILWDYFLKPEFVLIVSFVCRIKIFHKISLYVIHIILFDVFGLATIRMSKGYFFCLVPTIRTGELTKIWIYNVDDKRWV